ncbi:MAG: 2,3-bisphosphoglycerate-dependent phosphoglycerate mutase [Elusimicrobia bacterium RIFCSPLOWO2_12_FULL_59_9]|nr:MAG: 2,3-bisphosphoglycerate-dependent phosphoglycerate mutase [Elusimicrobia bacterium RIFCSPLOWO2_12_FULL_59_9]
MRRLVLLRHGQSEWNLKNIFTGWVDVDLSEKGVEEAARAGTLLKQFKFDIAYTSALKRAQKTLDIVLKSLGQEDIPVIKDPALNERHYGDLQGLNKDEMRLKYGEEQVHIWRRSYDVKPPGGESLKDTAERTLPFFKKFIVEDLRRGKDVLVSAHGNSLRAIVMDLDNLSGEEIMKVNLDTGIPILYKFGHDLTILSKSVIQPSLPQSS